MKPRRSLAVVLGLGLLLGGASARSRHHRAHHSAPPPRFSASSPWSSPEACNAALSRKMTKPRSAGTVRLATWNVRWFPDGVPGTSSGRGEKATNLDWLACAIAWLDADVLALEEIKNTPSATAAIEALIASLDRTTGGHHHVEVDHCPGLGRQSVAFLYDERRVSARGFRDLDALNPGGHACDEHLRPGFTGYFRFPGGADAHLVAVHLKSGAGTRDSALRERSLAGFGPAYRDLQSTEPDSDVVVLGDFNTMGCDECTPRMTSEEESAREGTALAAANPPFRQLTTDRACSEYYHGAGNLLDHVAVSEGMHEVSAGVRARVDGYCAELSCARVPKHEMPRAYEELSDHCPVVVDFDDRDLD